ncbi:MAG TPA: hypothetical protein DIS78_09440 [Lachnospiraceae bacterium]|nr:hypothetical protein [Lachnospiraceae bacterium]
MREYLRDRTWREKIANVWVMHGFSTCLPFEDNTFDAVISSGDDRSITDEPNEEFISRGFEWLRHECICMEGPGNSDV